MPASLSIQLENYQDMLIMGHRGYWSVCEMMEGGLYRFLQDKPFKLPKQKVLETFTTKAAAKKFIRELKHGGNPTRALA